jgi:hypothetical protein
VAASGMRRRRGAVCASRYRAPEAGAGTVSSAVGTPEWPAACRVHRCARRRLHGASANTSKYAMQDVGGHLARVTLGRMPAHRRAAPVLANHQLGGP